MKYQNTVATITIRIGATKIENIAHVTTPFTNFQLFNWVVNFLKYEQATTFSIHILITVPQHIRGFERYEL